MTRVRPIPQAVVLVAVAVWMWLAMMLTHELGHVAAATLSGGEVIGLELRPGRLSHTLVRPNPHPSVVLWGGFVSGWVVPQLTAPAWGIQGGLAGPVLRAWAAFCLLAGGCYLAIGGGERLTDTGQLLAEGWSHAVLIVVGAAVAGLGYYRSRSAWIRIAERLAARPLVGSDAIAWWCALAAWSAGQWGLHCLLEPASNVR